MFLGTQFYGRFILKKIVFLSILIIMITLSSFQVNAEAATAAAVKTSSKVLVDQVSKSFDAYNINGNNYFKLRDIAFVLNGTLKQFEIEWDGAKNAIDISSGYSYSVVGGEMKSSDGSTVKAAIPTSSKIYLDDKEVFFTAFNIDGNNYFKLRDLGQSLDFGVGWNASENTVEISSTIGYTPEQPPANTQDVCSAGVCIDVDKKNLGLVRIGYLGSSTEKVKVLISKDGNQYIYPLKTDGVMVGFPLQMGNGDYKISVLSNIGNNQYAYLKTSNISVEIKRPNDVYLNSIQTISWSSESLAAKKNLSLIGLETDYTKRITLGYDFIVQNILYDFDKISTLTSDYIPIPDKTLLALKGICYDYSSLFAAMKRSEGVPIKLVKGYSTLVDGYHAWNEVFIDGKWIVVDTTVDAAYYKGKVKFSFSKNVADYTKVYEY